MLSRHLKVLWIAYKKFLMYFKEEPWKPGRQQVIQTICINLFFLMFIFIRDAQ